MFCPSGCLRLLARELSVLAALLSVAASANANNDWTHDIATLPQTAAREPLADSGTKIISLTDLTEYRYDEESTEELPSDVVPGDEYLLDAWSWQWLPAGLIYHSYMAGVHEPRMGIVAFHEGEGRTLWDATLGGRVGLLRYGDCRTMVPEGYQLDFYGAAVARLDVEHRQDLDSTDYVFGFPLTYGIGNTQLKLGYAHLSSHLGDELAIREPGTLSQRINYVRDSIVFGASHYPLPDLAALWRSGLGISQQRRCPAVGQSIRHGAYAARCHGRILHAVLGRERSRAGGARFRRRCHGASRLAATRGERANAAAGSPLLQWQVKPIPIQCQV